MSQKLCRITTREANNLPQDAVGVVYQGEDPIYVLLPRAPSPASPTERAVIEAAEAERDECWTCPDYPGLLNAAHPAIRRLVEKVDALRAERAPKPRYKIMEGACYFVPDSRNIRDIIIVDEVGIIVAKAPTEERAQQLLELLNAAEAKK